MMKVYLFLLLVAIPLVSLTSQNIPIDFETSGNGANWTWTTFENATNPPLEIVANPDVSGINTSSTVAKFTALQAGQPFAGCESLHGAGIGTFTITEASSIIRIMVWKSVVSDVGIKLVRSDNWSLGEIKIANKLVNTWEQLEFDFSAHIGNTYDQIVIFPDFNARGSDQVIYFDNIYGAAAGSTATKELTNAALKIFPNPSSDYLSIQSEALLDSYQVYSLTGQLVAEARVNGKTSTINMASFTKGIYLLKARVDGQIIVSKFVKN